MQTQTNVMDVGTAWKVVAASILDVAVLPARVLWHQAKTIARSRYQGSVDAFMHTGMSVAGAATFGYLVPRGVAGIADLAGADIPLWAKVGIGAVAAYTRLARLGVSGRYHEHFVSLPLAAQAGRPKVVPQP